MTLPVAEVGFAEATWILVVKSIVIFAAVFAIAPVLTVVERKVLGRFQARYGPNRVGPFGLLQPLADAVKLITKEGYRPENAVPILWAIAPAIVIFTGVATLAIIPFGNVKDGVGFYGIDVSIGILYFFAFGSIAFYGLLLGGWASGSKYSFLGAMRSAAQLISYEISMGLALLGAIMMAGSLSLVSIVEAQDEIWYVIPQIVGFLIFMVAGFAEAGRPPFDLPEADAELVPGVPDRVRRDALRLLRAGRVHRDVRRLGGGGDLLPRRLARPRPRLARPDLGAGEDPRAGVRLHVGAGDVPRIRYDQLMSLGWKVLLPLATLNVLVTAVLVTRREPGVSVSARRLGGRRPAGAAARRGRGAPTAPSARRCAA